MVGIVKMCSPPAGKALRWDPGTGKAGNRSSDRKGEMTVGCIVKTFIIYDMCKGEQIGNFAKSEEFRRLVHEEMSKVSQ